MKNLIISEKHLDKTNNKTLTSNLHFESMKNEGIFDYLGKLSQNKLLIILPKLSKEKPNLVLYYLLANPAILSNIDSSGIKLMDEILIQIDKESFSKISKINGFNKLLISLINYHNKSYFDQEKSEDLRHKLFTLFDDKNKIIFDFMNRIDSNFLYIYFSGEKVYKEQVDLLKQFQQDAFTYYQITQSTNLSKKIKNYLEGIK